MIDLSINSDYLFIDDIFSAAIQEIDIVFNTNYTELLGNPKFGSEFSVFLHSLQLSTQELESYIDRVLEQCNCLSRINYEKQIILEYDEANFDRVIYVKLTLYDDTTEVEKTYNISNLLYTDLR